MRDSRNRRRSPDPTQRLSEERTDGKHPMTQTSDGGVSKSWAALPVLERLSQPGEEMTSEEIAKLVGTRSVSGIASRMKWSRDQLSDAGVPFNEAVTRSTKGGRIVWSAGRRVAQARHLMRLKRQGCPSSGWGDDVPLEDVSPGDPRPSLVLRTLARRGRCLEFRGPIADLEKWIDDPEIDLNEGGLGFAWPAEIFVERIEPGADGCRIEIPPGYGEDGIWCARLTGRR